MMIIQSSSWNSSYRCFMVVLLLLSLVKLVAVRVGPFHSSQSQDVGQDRTWGKSVQASQHFPVLIRQGCIQAPQAGPVRSQLYEWLQSSLPGPDHQSIWSSGGKAVVIDYEVHCKSATAATMPMEWFSWLAEVGMEKHGRLMVMNHLEEGDIVHFDHDLLRSIGVLSAKDRLLILSLKKKHMRRARGKPSLSLSSQITSEAQATIIERVQTLHVDEVKLLLWAKTTWLLCSREVLQLQGYLSSTAPLPGSSNLVTDADRTTQGTELLNSAKDMLWAALYGSAEENVNIARVERELLVITVPGQKAFVFNFFQAVTEVGALGTWRDPDERSDDDDAPNMLLQVEYGESASEMVGDAVMVAIHLINLLQVNEVLLYARSSNVEQSTLSTQLYFQRHQPKASRTLLQQQQHHLPTSQPQEK